MKRSQINGIIRDSLEFFDRYGFLLPPFARYSPAQFRALGSEADEIFAVALGWDITSFGTEDFAHTGLVLFTLRNGSFTDPVYPKPYAEKIMIVRENQITPRHFHWHKQEDIINRGGGNLIIELFRADPERNRLSEENTFEISVDGRRRTMRSGEQLKLKPGDSVCLKSIHAHRFYGEPGCGPVLVGEVSCSNDDTCDNCFIDGVPRFDVLEEDVPAEFPLSGDYPALRAAMAKD